ncbi:MAG: ATP-binding protein [Candidatus Ratteibacteria bacterium]|nr:ATP-binding protein [Candidatus Ratteibacteria bacterium]
MEPEFFYFYDMRKGVYIFLIFILILGIFAFSPLILNPEFSNKIYFVSLFFFIIGFILALILILVLLIPFNIFSKNNRYTSRYLDELSAISMQARKEMKEINEKLDKELKIRNRQLKSMGSELLSAQIELLQKEKLASLAKMASGVVHQIRNPLAIIKNATYLLKKKTADNGNLKDEIKIIEDEADRMNKMAAELLRFARTEERIMLEPVDLNDIVREILKEVSITEKNYQKVKIENLLADSSSRAQGEKESLKQAISNIICNAYQAMPKGGTLKLEAYETDKEVRLDISDTGTGIPVKERELIFEPLFTTKGKEGSGLGMAISYAVIKKIGGDIKVESQEGKGTTFNVTLKKAEDR